MIFRDRDVFFDKFGRIYVTLGYLQPPDRVLSFLKYIPCKKGEVNPQWKSNKIYYRRIFWGTVESVKKGLAENIPSYTIADPFFGTDLIQVPHSDIKNHFIPEHRIREIIENPRDSLEKKVAYIAKLLHTVLKIPYKDLGVAGSILWKGHQPNFSDVNMNIYGFENAWKLQRNYEKLVEEDSRVKLRKVEQWENTMKRITDRCPLNLEDVKILFLRRKEIYYENEGIGIMPILRPNYDLLPIEYGTEIYKTELDNIKIQGEIVKDIHSLFMPAIYELEPYRNEKNKISDLDSDNLRILIYDGSFRSLFRENDHVKISGTLQKVLNVHDESLKTIQIMIGTKKGAGQEYMALSRS